MGKGMALVLLALLYLLPDYQAFSQPASLGGKAPVSLGGSQRNMEG